MCINIPYHVNQFQFYKKYYKLDHNLKTRHTTSYNSTNSERILMVLNVQSYGEVENRAIAASPNRIIEACLPEVFLKVGYPVNISEDSQLFRYVDVMHELRQTLDYSDLLGGLTTEEFAEFEAVSRGVVDFTSKKFGRPMVPKSSLLRAFYTFRTIRDMAPDTNTVILECGPGCGYLGLLLARAGYPYVANEITQAFYLYQSCLWQHFFPDRLIELATDERGLEDFDNISSGDLLHIPWWKFTKSNPIEPQFTVDLVTCNHMLCEMHGYAMNYLVKFVRNSLLKSGHPGLFFAEGMGSELVRHRYTAYDVFKRLGYARAYADTTIDVWLPAEKSNWIENYGSKEHEKSVIAPTLTSMQKPWSERSFCSKLTYLGLRARQVLKEKGLSEMLKRVGKVLRGKTTSHEMIAKATEDNPYPLLPQSNTVSYSIRSGRLARENLSRVPFSKLTSMQGLLMDGRDPRTEDELFFQYCFGEDYYS